MCEARVQNVQTYFRVQKLVLCFHRMLWCSVLQITLLKQAVANLHQTKVGDGDLVEDHWDCLWIWKWKVCMLEILRSALWLATDGTAPPGPWVSQLPTALHNNLTQSEVSASTCLTNSYSMSCHSIVYCLLLLYLPIIGHILATWHHTFHAQIAHFSENLRTAISTSTFSLTSLLWIADRLRWGFKLSEQDF